MKKPGYEYKKPRKHIPAWAVLLIILIILAGAGFCGYNYLIREYEIKNVYVEGSSHYTDDEIKEIVLSGKYGNNSLFLSHKYKELEINDIPFIQTINVSVLDKESIRITVHEKALAGCVSYLGRYIYFDKDGIVVETSDKATAGVPEIVGIDFDYVVLYEKLPAEDERLFKKVLDITLLMTKYKVSADKMYFAPNGNIYLYWELIEISLGEDENLDIKIMNLPSILDKLHGMKGILHMENYDEGTKRVSFETKK